MSNKTLKYRDFEKQFPEYLILRKEGCFYMSYNKSAKVLSYVMDYALGEDAYGRPVTGGSDPDKIINILKAEDFNFLVIEDNRITDGSSGRNPFEFYRV